MEEQKDYTRIRQGAVEILDDILSIIIDSMDYNITFMSRVKQTIKGIES